MVVLYAYCENDGEYLFVPEEEADYLAAIQRTLWTSQTWGEFWDLLPPREREVRRSRLEDLAADFESIDDLESAASYRLADNDASDCNDVPGVLDDDYPPVVNRDLVEWIPKDIARDYGTWESSPVSGDFLRFDLAESQLSHLLAAFAAHGYHLVHDEE